MNIKSKTDLVLQKLFAVAATPQENDLRNYRLGVDDYIVAKAIELLRQEGFETFLQQTGDDALFHVIAMRNEDSGEELAIIYAHADIESLFHEQGITTYPQIWRATVQQIRNGGDVEPCYVADYVAEKMMGIRCPSTGFKFGHF